MSGSYVAREMGALVGRLCLSAMAMGSLRILFRIPISNVWVNTFLLFAPLMIWFPGVDSGLVSKRFARTTTWVCVVLAAAGIAVSWMQMQSVGGKS